MWVWEELRVGETPGAKGQHAFDNLRLKLRREAGWDTDTGGKRPQIENRASSEPQNSKEKSALRPEKAQQRKREAGKLGKVKSGFHRDRAAGLVRGFQKRLGRPSVVLG